MKRYTIWTAAENELDTVMRLLHDRVRWLQDQGSDQWSTYKRWRPEMEEHIRRYETWLLRDGTTHEPIGTITMSPVGDPEFWSEQERQVPALYLAKLATSLAHRGHGLGRLLLEFSLYSAVTRQLAEVRMDVWRTATSLHDYYQRQGWSYVRTVYLPHRNSGVLFSRAAMPPKVNMPPHGVEVRPPGAGIQDQPRRPMEPGEKDWYGPHALINIC